MNTLPYEAQTALVSLIAALLIGGPVSLLGAGNALGLARMAVAVAVRHRMATMFGVSALSSLGAYATGLFNPADVQAAGFLGGLFG